MRCLLPLTVYCISLVSLQRLQAVPVEERPDSSTRSDLLSKLMVPREDKALASGNQPNTAMPSSAPSQSPKWLAGFLRHPPASGARIGSPNLAWLSKALQIKTRALRVRRHAHSGSRGGHHYPHNAKMMRVGCVLGTCQVQNLSHRLYQLIGQSGREDSSPINPRSPHSYG
ncbi:protein ADM2a [Hippoglossus stenolepis]|uniref:protein ADM2a n=1 Tax=Hippoglossus stenolepis TaxID=195615 RepID=UPI00159C9A80|nr:protein ADM2a [Hippoglossus stenolepis]